jgi:tetratricopeptide (TPR) repeat protein
MHTIVGVLLEAQAKPAEARKRYEDALDIDTGAAVAANNLAWMYAEGGTELTRALELARSAKTQLPDRPEISDTLGWVLYKKGDYELAIPAFLEAVGSAPKNAAYHYHLGLAYQGHGRRPQAIAALEASLALDSTSATAQQVRQKLAELKG